MPNLNPAAQHALISDIVGITGLAGIVTGAEMEPYLQGARYGKGRALCVARPATSEQVASLVAFCAARGIAIVPQGANTGLVGSSTPDMSGTQIVLSLTRLRNQCVVDAASRTVDVEAGVLLHELNEMLLPYGLWFPVDLAADPSVGGMIAANTGGTRLLRYGDVRHNLLAVEAVLFDPPGKLVRFGAPLRKNNTGFDLMQLFVGTGGATGIITRATLEVAIKPRQTVTALIVPATQDSVTALLLQAEQQLGDFLSAFEGISRNAMQAALDHVPSLRNPFGSEVPDFALLIELSSGAGLESGLNVEELLLGFLEQRIGVDVANAVVGKGAELWQLRHSLSDGARALGKVIGFDISVKRADVMRFRQVATALVASRYPQLMVVDFGHVGDGGIHFNVIWPYTSDIPYDAMVVEQLRDDVYDLVVAQFDGSYSAEHGIGPHNYAIYLRYTPEVVLRLAGRLQGLVDPRSIGAGIRFGREEPPILMAGAMP